MKVKHKKYLSCFMLEDPKNNPIFATGNAYSKNLSQLIEQISGICAICLNDFKKPAKLDSCTHIFCTECIKLWKKRKTSCPLCKKKFNKITSITKIANK